MGSTSPELFLGKLFSALPVFVSTSLLRKGFECLESTEVVYRNRGQREINVWVNFKVLPLCG